MQTTSPLFQSAPRSRERGDHRPRHCDPSPFLVSIRAPLSRAGRLQAPHDGATPRRFQSAPRSRERGDWHRIEGQGVIQMFQSAPRSRERGDLIPVASPEKIDKFQSAPRSRERGDRGRRKGGEGDCVSIRAPLSRAGRHMSTGSIGKTAGVSIRAPLSRAGRPLSPQVAPPPSEFQSAPRSRERGDFKSSAQKRETSCFNPRPALASGATAPEIPH